MAINETFELNSRARLGGLEDAIDRMEDFADRLDDIEDAGENAERGSDKASGGFSRLLGILGGLAGGLAIGATLMSGFNQVLDTQDAMNGFAAATGTAVDELGAYEEIAESIFTNNWGDSITDVAESMATVKNITGASADELERMTTNAIILRDVFGADVTESVRTVDTLMEQFGITSDEAFDLLTVGFQRTGDPAGDLLDTFNEYSGNFAQLGLDADEAMGIIIGGMENGARNTDDIADSMREFNIRMLEGLNGNEDWQDAFLALGGDAQFFFDGLQNGSLEGASGLAFALQALQEIEDPLERNRLGVELFGTKWEDMGEQVFEGMALGVDGLEGFEGATQQAGDTVSRGLGPALNQLKRIAMVTLANALTPFVNLLLDEGIPALSEIGAIINNDVVPVLEDMTDVLFEGVDAVLAFANDNPQLIEFLKFFAIGVGALVAALVIYNVMMWGATAATGAFLAIMAILTSPIVLIIAGLALLYAAFQTNFLGIGDFIRDAVERIKTFMLGLWEDIQPYWDAFKNGIEAVVNYVKDVIAPRVGEFIGDVVTAAENLWTDIQPYWDSFKTGIRDAVNFVRDYVITPLVNKFGVMITKAQQIWTDIQPSIQAVRDGIETAFNWVKDNVIDPLITKITGLVSKLDIWAAVSGVIGLFQWGIMGAFDYVKTFVIQPVIDIIQTLIDKASDIWDTISPALTDLKNGFIDVFEKLKQPVQDVIDKIGEIGGVVEGAKGVLQDIGDTVGVTDRSGSSLGGFAAAAQNATASAGGGRTESTFVPAFDTPSFSGGRTESVAFNTAPQIIQVVMPNGQVLAEVVNDQNSRSQIR